MADEKNRIYGILNEIEGEITLFEILQVIKAIECDDYFPVLQKLLNEKYGGEPKVSIKDALYVVQREEFALALPMRLNNHPSYLNLILLKAAILVFKRGLLSIQEIKSSVQAFYATERHSRSRNLPLDPHEIAQVMKIANKAMSEKKIQFWLDHYDPILHWRQEASSELKRFPLDIEKVKNLACIYPHEFLYIICNAINRLEYMKKMPLHREKKMKRNALEMCLIPMDELLLHPNCKTIDDQLQSTLDKEFEAFRYNYFFEGVKVNSPTEKIQVGFRLPALISPPKTRKQEVQLRSFREDQHLFRDPKSYLAIRSELNLLKKIRPSSLIPRSPSNRHIICSLKNTRVYKKIRKSQPHVFRANFINISIERSESKNTARSVIVERTTPQTSARTSAGLRASVVRRSPPQSRFLKQK